MTPPSPDTRTERLREAVAKFNLAGPHACCCPRSTDTGCTCAMKDEYVDEVMHLIASEVATSNRELLERLKANQFDAHEYDREAEGETWVVGVWDIEAELTRLEDGTEGAST